MTNLIKTFSDGSTLEYDRGRFDDWCVYLTIDGIRFPPLDMQYFNLTKWLGKKYSNEIVYNDFVELYEFVRIVKAINQDGHNLIDNVIVKYHGTDRLKADILFTIYYAAMVAEECKENTRLGAKIKRLGVHQILMDSPTKTVKEAAKFSFGMKWYTIEKHCVKRGF